MVIWRGGSQQARRRAAARRRNDGLRFKVGKLYRAQITPSLAVAPDVQLLHDPGGDGGPDDALVLTLRCELVF